MAVSTNIKEAGWFYHAPKQHVARDPVLYPPASQIPGLSCNEATQGEPAPKSLFKDTDTKYIRLAKQGGRQDLLCFRDNEKKSKEPVGYPTCEWFSQNVNQNQAEENKVKHEFLLPAYMVNEEYKPNGDNVDYQPRRGPFDFDKKSAYQRGEHATDKTVKLPELRKPGYGVRSGKPLHFKRNPPPERARGPNTQSASEAQRIPQESRDKATIEKILSYKYGHDWNDEVKSIQAKQEKGRMKNKVGGGSKNEPAVKSEYYDKYGKTEEKDNKNKKWKDRKSSGDDENSRRRRREAEQNEQDAKLWNMTRFKNVPARTDHHMSNDIMAATVADYEIPAASPIPTRRRPEPEKQEKVAHLEIKKPEPKKARHETKKDTHDEQDVYLDDDVTMEKILTQRYLYEAEENRKKMKEEEKKRNVNKGNSKADQKDISEYIEEYGRHLEEMKKKKKKHHGGDGQGAGRFHCGCLDDECKFNGTDVRLWYMNRFRNVPARTDNHMPQEIMSATAADYEIPKSSPILRRRAEPDKQDRVPLLVIKKAEPKRARNDKKKETQRSEREDSPVDDATIQKLVSHAYMYEAEERNNKEKEERERKNKGKADQKDITEYIQEYGRHLQEVKKKNKHGDGGGGGTGQFHCRCLDDECKFNGIAEKLWHMNKFRNVPARTDNHMPPEIMAATQ